MRLDRVFRSGTSDTSAVRPVRISRNCFQELLHGDKETQDRA